MKPQLQNTTIIRSPLQHIPTYDVGGCMKKNCDNIFKKGKSSSARTISYINFEKETKRSKKRSRRTIYYIIEHILKIYRLNDTEGRP